MSTTINTELRSFQRAVKDQLDRVRHYSPSIVDGVERALGLDNFIDDQVVTVRVTVPASNAGEAQDQVQDQIDDLFLPSGWSAEVSV